MEDHSYVIIEILKCHDAIRSENDPECADRDKINEWIETKQL